MKAKLKQIVIETCKRKAVIIAAILIVLYTVTGFFLLPYVIERFLPNSLSQRLDSEVSLQQVKINPFTLTLEAREFQINEPSGRAMAGFQRLYINFQLSSLFRWALTFADIIVDAPSINVVIDPDGKLNLARLAGKDHAAPAEETNRPVRVLLHNIHINDGKIDVADTRQQIPATVSFSLMNIKLTNISTLPEREGPYTLTATTTDGATLQWSGQVSLHPLRSEGVLKFKQISLISPWKFIRSQLNIAPPEGHLSFETRYLIDLGTDTTIVTWDDIRVRIMDAGIQIEGAEEAFLNLPEIHLNIGKLDMIQRRIDDVRLAIRGGDLDLIKDKDSILNIQRLTNRENDPASPPSAPSGEQGEPWDIDITDINLGGMALNYMDRSMAPAVSFSTDEVHLAFKAAVTTGSPKPQVQVKDFDLTLQQIALGFVDTSQPAFQISNLTVAGAFDVGARFASISRLDLTDGTVNVIRKKDNTVNLSQLFGTKTHAPDTSDKDPQAENGGLWQFIAETVSLSGLKTRFFDLTVAGENPLIELDKINLTVFTIDGKSPSPFEMDLRVVQGGKLKASGTFDPSGTQVESTITIKEFALRTLQPYIARIADLTLNTGLLSTRGTFHRAAQGDMAYQGQVGIADLQIIENSTRDTLLGWQQLQTSDFRLNLNPSGLEIDTVKLTGLTEKLLIAEDKTVNVVEAFKSKSRPTEIRQEESVPKAPGSSFPVRIGKLRLDKGMLDFADLSLSPKFAIKIHELTGMIVGISSSPGARTQVELKGRVDEYGTSKIYGEINAFNPKQFTDIAMDFRNVEMTTLSPYSGKFAGRIIDSGKLSLDLEYKVASSKLLGDNKIVINSLKLGEKVESPDAVSLPLDLAIALLKDADGVIDIDLPVSGNLDDPKFRYGALIRKAFVNLLTKIVTSPFRALAALFGGGEEVLNAVNFEPGAGKVPPPEQEKLATLLKALTKRPQLKLVVTGRYHSDSDGQAIKQLQVRRALAKASGTVLKPGEDPGPVDFSNPDSQQTLVALFVDRYGKEAYEKLRVEMAPSDKSGTSEKPHKDPGKLAKLLFSDLIKREPVDPTMLKQLADERAQAIVQQMTGPEGIPHERIVVKPSEGTNSGDSISSILGLDAMTSKPEG